MVDFDQVKIRATIDVGGAIISTPDILSFSVTRARGQMCATFQASVKIPGDVTFGAGGKIVISANAGTIFTGYVKKMSISPSKTDSSHVIVNMSGRDVLSVLEGITFSRRVDAMKMARFGVISSIVQRNESYKERFPAKVWDNEEKYTSYQIMDGEGQLTAANPVVLPSITGPQSTNAGSLSVRRKPTT